MRTGVLSRNNVLLLVVMFIAIGTLVARDFPQAGLVITLCALVGYIIYGLPGCVRCARRFGSSGTKQRVRLAILSVLLGLLVSAAVTGTVFYFLILTLLAVDFVLEDKKKKA